MRLKGYTGKVLHIDLSGSKGFAEDLREDDALRFMGGSGLATKYLYEMTDEKTDPLGPGNPLIYMTGPFAGTPVLFSGRHHVVSGSPLTGIFGESNIGSSWGPTLKRAGFDGVIVTGKSEKPVYLWIHDGAWEIRDASRHWGKDTYEVEQGLKDETHGKAEMQVIGQAGENQVPLSAILTGGKDGRAAGRCGLGAVMGSKKLKAVVVYGTGKVPVHDQAAVKRLNKERSALIMEKSEGLRAHGTAGGVARFETMGWLPLQNWKYAGRWKESAEKINGTIMTDTILTGRYFCEGCIVGCGREIKIEKGPYAGVSGAGPEYESLAMLGSCCLIDDLEAICYANELCNRFGLDTMSAGQVIAFGMEAYEKGLIDRKDTGGIELRWGDSAALIEMIKKIALKEGLGEVLGKGVRRASEEIGKNSVEFAMHIKGLEVPGHDARAYSAGALAFATSARGACHLSGFSHCLERGKGSLRLPEIGLAEGTDPFDVEGKGILTAKSQNVMGMMDSLILCKQGLHAGFTLTDIMTVYRDVTGVEMKIDDFMLIGERIFNLKRMYNVRRGISRKDDNLPLRFQTLRRTGEGVTSSLPPLGRMLAEYYDYRGWSEDGIPTAERLKELGL
jgi:aldehyde:ferredoxin oxidoreductase